MINFLSKKNERNLIYVLDYLLQIAVNGERITKAKNIDLALYKLLNKAEVNQKIVHLGCLPTTRKNQAVTSDFADFINKLSMYMEYDINTDFVWAQVAEDDSGQRSLHKKAVLLKKDILDYLLEKQAIPEIEYYEHLNKEVKRLV